MYMYPVNRIIQPSNNWGLMYMFKIFFASVTSQIHLFEVVMLI